MINLTKEEAQELYLFLEGAIVPWIKVSSDITLYQVSTILKIRKRILEELKKND